MNRKKGKTLNLNIYRNSGLQLYFKKKNHKGKQIVRKYNLCFFFFRSGNAIQQFSRKSNESEQKKKQIKNNAIFSPNKLITEHRSTRHFNYSYFVIMHFLAFFHNTNKKWFG